MSDVRSSPIAIPEKDLQDLRERLRATRWPEDATAPAWAQGVPLATLQSLCEYWASDYDWRRCEALLNGWNPQVTTINGVDIHVFEVRSPVPDALPVILTHGWPGTVLEFHKVAGPLTHPARYGGDPADAMHLVLPSLPGYGFSGKPDGTGWNADRIAAAWAELMVRLGHGDRWAAQGGDWGAEISARIGGLAPAGCIGVHLNFLSYTPSEEDIAHANDEEKEILARARHYNEEFSGYKTEQGSRPQTLGYALADSPSGQAAWIYEKFHDWTGGDGEPETVLTRDEMLDIISMYWLTNTAASSARLYWESKHTPSRQDADGGPPKVELPAAFSLFPEDIMGASQRWAAKRFTHIVQWGRPEKGGHFAAMEQPEVFVRELREGMRRIRGV